MIVVAHRGASWYAPENTMAAFDKAVELGCSDMEFDVQLSRDEVPVVIHDNVVDVTTDGGGAVAQMTLAELKTLDAGSWFSPQFSGQRIPTLEEVLQRYSGKICMHPEIKTNSPELAAKVVEMLRTYGQDDRSVAISFHWQVLERIKRLHPTQAIGHLTLGLQRELVEEAAKMRCLLVGIHPALNGTETRRFIERAHELGLGVLGFGLGMKRDFRLAFQAGFDLLTADYPDQVISMLQGWQKAQTP